MTAPRFDSKIALVLRDDLAAWQALNVTAFLSSGITGARPDLIGRPYEDADGTGYLPLLGQPVLVLTGDAALLAGAHARALDRGLAVAVFVEEMFATGHDAANRAAVRAVPRAGLRLVGLGVHGDRRAVDKALRGARMHP